MAKIGVLTFHKISNYGAVLQGYALQQAIIKLGYQCEVIDFLFPVHRDYEMVKRALPILSASGGVEQASLSTYIKIKMFLKKMLSHMLLKKQNERFSEFCDKHMIFSNKKFRNVDVLYEQPPEYDAYVTGSDQVWNPTYSHSPEPYFLTFVTEHKKRIAYAPSFGISEIPKETWPLYREWLLGISHLSVRESKGSQIIADITGKSSLVVLDPTLLLDSNDWDKVATIKNVVEPYIFCYALVELPRMMELCYQLKKITGYQILKIGDVKNIFNNDIKAVLDAGPSEFLGLIKNAAIVVTNSFHGTCFSINYRKPFYTVLTTNSSQPSRNSRLINLLELLNLEKRLFTEESMLPDCDHIAIDYKHVESRLLEEKNKSIAFLKTALCASQIKETQ